MRDLAVLSPRLVVCGDAASVASRGTDNDAGVFVERTKDDVSPPDIDRETRKAARGVGKKRECAAPL